MNNDEIFAELKLSLDRSYAPYSKIHVASAVVFDKDGQRKVVFGTNVENASYGLTICAERSAIFQASHLGMREILEVHIISNLKDPVMPCGACRQVISEFSSTPDQPKIFCYNKAGDKEQYTLGDLLPKGFRIEKK